MLETADIPLVFGTHWQYRGNSTELEWMTSFSMQGTCRFAFLEHSFARRFTRLTIAKDSGKVLLPTQALIL
jgi:hypothetical protein